MRRLPRAGAGDRAQSETPFSTARWFPLFSDLLLHDVGTGDGIAQGDGGPGEIRTPGVVGPSFSTTATARWQRRHDCRGGRSARRGGWDSAHPPRIVVTTGRLGSARISGVAVAGARAQCPTGLPAPPAAFQFPSSFLLAPISCFLLPSRLPRPNHLQLGSCAHPNRDRPVAAAAHDDLVGCCVPRLDTHGLTWCQVARLQEAQKGPHLDRRLG